MEFKEYAKSYIEKLVEILKNINLNELKQIEEILTDAYKEDRIVYIMGNGGSAATASHWACDFNKGTACKNKKRFRFISLNDNIAHFTAIANDISYDDIFSEQLKNILTPEDIVFTISASGNSKNIVKAIEYGNKIGAKTIALVGFSGGKAKELADFSIHINNMDYGPVEDLHMILDHLLSTYFKENIIKGIE